MPGMRMSRKAMSGAWRSMAAIASIPSAASSLITSSGQSAVRRRRSSWRRNGSSSAMTAVGIGSVP